MSRTEFPDQIVDFRVNADQSPSASPGCRKAISKLRSKTSPHFNTSNLPNMIALPQGAFNPAVRSNKSLPAGFVVFGQFLSHDISINRLNGTAPALQLQSLYGNGASTNPYLYVHNPSDWHREMSKHPNALTPPQSDAYFFRGVKLMLRHTQLNGADRYDVPRAQNSLALMADNRNDQHFLILQLHVAFIRFHNAVVDYMAHLVHKKPQNGLPPQSLQGVELFQASRQVVVALYHKIVVDYLQKSVSDPKLIDDLFANDHAFKLFDPKAQPELMPEFMDAALRTGHSQISEEYSFPNNVNRYIYHPNSPDLRGHKDRIKDDDKKLQMYWRWYFDLGYGDTGFMPSSAIDTQIVAPVSQLPFLPQKSRSIAARDLARAHTTPPGLAYAKILFKSQPDKILSLEQIKTWAGSSVPNPKDLPLWAYLLLEAQTMEKGKRLGPLGSQILAEQVVWILRNAGVKPRRADLPQLVLADGSPFDPAIELTAWRDLAEGYLPERKGDSWGIRDLIELPNFVKELVNYKKTSTPTSRKSMPTNESPSTSLEMFSDPGPTPPNDGPQNFDPSTFSPSFDDEAMAAMFGTDALYEDAETIMFYFSQTAVADRVGINSADFDEEIDGITLFLGLRDEKLVAVARATNDRQVFFPNTDYFISGENTTFVYTDSDFVDAAQALINEGFSTVQGLTTAPAFTFKKSQLHALLCDTAFVGMDADVTFTVFTGLLVPDQLSTALPDTYLNAYLTPLAGASNTNLGCAYSFTHPKYCYYPGL